ncbi:hypothetical protein UY3_14319 [Chelonia mydas]|uniref:Uncharacterized protein n=1 Tax=Chelonia mydas TaxID=8469 RepID=M7B8T2_CHEMY|nr:hypothetical protein UY3_14319 [Chelonia mydas]
MEKKNGWEPALPLHQRFTITGSSLTDGKLLLLPLMSTNFNATYSAQHLSGFGLGYSKEPKGGQHSRKANKMRKKWYYPEVGSRAAMTFRNNMISMFEQERRTLSILQTAVVTGGTQSYKAQRPFLSPVHCIDFNGVAGVEHFTESGPYIR